MFLEQVHFVSSSKEKAEEKEKATSMRAALEGQMDHLRDVHHKQVRIYKTKTVYTYIINKPIVQNGRIIKVNML